MSCPGKHTKFQPTDSQWYCPKCGAGTYDFYIDCSPGDADPDCEKLHIGDSVVCTSCTRGNSHHTGDQIAKAMVKKLHFMQCSHCKGSGFVQKSEGL